jgi:DNA-binding SARP family transcriptional activator
MLAIKYDLHELSTMAKREFHKEGNQLKLKEILQILCDIRWFESDDNEEKDLVEYLFERAASIRPGEENETIVLKDYLDDEEWSYEAMFNSVLKQRAEMQALKRQAS